MQQEKRTCSKCKQELSLCEFYKNPNTGAISSYCRECGKVMKRKSRKKPDGIFMHASYGRVMEHKGQTLRIYWSGNMISILQRHFPNTKTKEVAEMLGVSSRTVIRKARELGIEKDKDFVQSVWRENNLVAQVAARKSEKARWEKGHVPWNKGMTKGMKQSSGREQST